MSLRNRKGQFSCLKFTKTKLLLLFGSITKNRLRKINTNHRQHTTPHAQAQESILFFLINGVQKNPHFFKYNTKTVCLIYPVPFHLMPIWKMSLISFVGEKKPDILSKQFCMIFEKLSFFFINPLDFIKGFPKYKLRPSV